MVWFMSFLTCAPRAKVNVDRKKVSAEGAFMAEKEILRERKRQSA